ncbi:hypothetical protein [Lactobacillus helveticus]|uniref:hypothetical protein n=1 Tax=Lactobacillus helveticus TaxID=1587 RepID=UPI00156239E1|nr:hypothetical protein [Lactobacillus helveticus]NRO88854.1 hypothetical protein [Lactobacillus helveticus]
MADGYTNKLRQTVLTNNGRNTFLQVSNGDGTLVYTRASLTSQSMNDSSGNPLNNEIIANLSSLSDDLKDGKLQITPVTGNQFELIANFDNKNQGQDINFSAIGWYARIDTKNDSGQTVEGSEVLIAVSPTTNATETLAAGSPDGLSTQVISAALDMNISNAANISMTVNDIGYVTRAELDAWQTKIEETISAGYVELPMRNNGGQQLFDHNGEAILFKKSLIDIDRSLSQEGKPADAGATGKKLNEINSSLEQLNQEIYKTFNTKENAQDLKNGILANADANNRQDEQINELTTATKENAQDLKNEIVANGGANDRQDGQINGLITRTNEIESGVINNARTIGILSHDGKSLATHANATITARTEYIKTDSTLSDYGAVANSGKVGEAIKQTFSILNASINRLVADYNSLQSNQVIVDLTNQVLALKDQNDGANNTIQALKDQYNGANNTIQALKKSVEISSAESQANNLDALYEPGRYYLGTANGYDDAVLEVATLGNTNKVMQYMFSAGNAQDRSERRIGTNSGGSYSWSAWNNEY